jgi:hypothetical protein
MNNYWAQWDREELMDMQGCNDTNCSELQQDFTELHDYYVGLSHKNSREDDMEFMNMTNYKD